MDEKLERYKGSLTRSQLITARNKVLNNARGLYEDAQLLYDNKRFSRAYFLLCICNEELGKSIMITSAIVKLVNGSIVWGKFWRYLRNHKYKTQMIEHMENVFVSSDENFKNPSDIQKYIPLLEEFKMASLYSDMFQNDFFDPNEIVPRQLVDSYLELTSNRIDLITSTAPSSKHLAEFTKKDISDFQLKYNLKLFKEK